MFVCNLQFSNAFVQRNINSFISNETVPLLIYNKISNHSQTFTYLYSYLWNQDYAGPWHRQCCDWYSIVMAIIVTVNIATNNVCSSMSQPQIVKWVPSELENGLATIEGTLVSKQL